MRVARDVTAVQSRSRAAFPFFNFLSPLISVALAFLGIRMLKARTPESSSKS